MAKFGSMMVDNDCDFIQRINDVKKRDGGKKIIFLLFLSHINLLFDVS